MNKKIDFYTKDNNCDPVQNTNKDMGKNTKGNAGSKTSKPVKVSKKKSSSSSGPKRRGRRPKKILESINPDSDDMKENTNQKNGSAVILQLKIDPSKLKNIKNKVTNNNNDEVKNKIDNNSLEQEDASSEGMFKNDIPCDNTCHNCAKNEKLLATVRSKLDKYEKKDKFDKTNKVYSNKLNFISCATGKKVVLKKTNVKCWWDCHPFSTLPCVLPELFHNNIYSVTGCFCSFNCALAYNLYYIKDSKIYYRKSLIYKLYRELHGLGTDDVVDIKEAPPKEILEDFGGDMSIDIFRKSFFMVNKEYIVYMPPIKPINITIEERNVDNGNEDDGKEYVLKRTKPLSKKKSIIASMKGSH